MIRRPPRSTRSYTLLPDPTLFRALYCPGKARLHRRVVGADVAAPGAVALFQAQGLDGAIAGVHQAVRRSRLHQRLVDVDGILRRQVQLPAEFADVGDAQRQHRAARSEEHTSELQSLMRISYAVFCLK